MNATCLHCHARFQGNDVVEAFPFARRVAYDPVKLRFWTVCHRCGKWSMAPMEEEERASAIEHFERWWRGNAAHYTAGGIGVGRYSERFTLVRVGEASWPEFASWRYGDTLKRRRMRQYVATAASTAVAGLFWATGFATLGSTAAILIGMPLVEHFVPDVYLRNKRPVCRVPAANGSRSTMRAKHLFHMELERLPGGWALNASHDAGVAHLTGEEAIRALGYSLARINYQGASRRGVEDALSVIAEAGGPEGVVERAAEPIAKSQGKGGDPGVVARYPAATRIALEMATREHAEQRAMDNEIALLRSEWAEAEEIASIASQLLFTPAGDARPST